MRPGIWCWVPCRTSATRRRRAQFPEVAYAAATTGPANLAACVVCRSDPELYEFLTRGVGGIQAIGRIETAPIIRTVKQASVMLAPGA